MNEQQDDDDDGLCFEYKNNFRINTIVFDV